MGTRCKLLKKNALPENIFVYLFLLNDACERKRMRNTIGLKMLSSIANESDEKNKVNLKSVVVTSTCSALAVLSHEYCFEKGKEHPEIENKMSTKEEDKTYRSL